MQVLLVEQHAAEGPSKTRVVVRGGRVLAARPSLGEWVGQPADRLLDGAGAQGWTVSEAPPLVVQTARISYSLSNRLDITRQAIDEARRKGRPEPPGAAFAPSWGILKPALDARGEITRRLKALAAHAPGVAPDEAVAAEIRAIHDRAWELYAPAYRAEMRVSAGMRPGHPRWRDAEEAAWQRGVRPMPSAWADLFTREYVVLVCYCVLDGDERCHRRLLAAEVLAKMGAVDLGEVGTVHRCCACGWPTSTKLCAVCADRARRAGAAVPALEPGPAWLGAPNVPRNP